MMLLFEIGLKMLDMDDCFKLISLIFVIFVVDDYEMLIGKCRYCYNEVNECIYWFENVKGFWVDFIFWVYNDGIVFCYYFFKIKEEIVVFDEYIVFVFILGIKCWI